MKNIILIVIFLVSFLFNAFSQTKQFRNNLYIIDPNGKQVLMDGTLSLYLDEYSDEVDYQDARKMTNPSENIGILRNERVLIVERRDEIDYRTDTIFFKFWNSRVITYRLELSGKNFEGSDISAILYDKYLNKEVGLSLLEDNYYDFSVTSDVNSKMEDRFMVVFNPVDARAAMGIMPLNFVNTSVSSDSKSVSIFWTTANENNVKNYLVEKSFDGLQFESTNLTVAAQNKQSNQYSAKDPVPYFGSAYYRIKATDLDGKTTYSKIVNVLVKNVSARLTLYPNPTTASEIYLAFNGQSAGTYRISIINGSGSIVQSLTELLSNSPVKINLSAGKHLSAGVYRVEVSGPEGYRSTHNLMIR